MKYKENHKYKLRKKENVKNRDTWDSFFLNKYCDTTLEILTINLSENRVLIKTWDEQTHSLEFHWLDEILKSPIDITLKDELFKL